MMEKQTAVEFLIYLFSETIDEEFYKKEIEVAKQMEIQQLEHCAMHFANYANTCLLLHKPMDGEKEFEKYHFENYGKNN